MREMLACTHSQQCTYIPYRRSSRSASSSYPYYVFHLLKIYCGLLSLLRDAHDRVNGTSISLCNLSKLDLNLSFLLSAPQIAASNLRSLFNLLRMSSYRPQAPNISTRRGNRKRDIFSLGSQTCSKIDSLLIPLTASTLCQMTDNWHSFQEE